MPVDRTLIGLDAPPFEDRYQQLNPISFRSGGGGVDDGSDDGGGEGNGASYNPSTHTAAEVVDYVESHPDQAQRVYDAEVSGKARSTVLANLETYL